MQELCLIWEEYVEAVFGQGTVLLLSSSCCAIFFFLLPLGRGPGRELAASSPRGELDPHLDYWYSSLLYVFHLQASRLRFKSKAQHIAWNGEERCPKGKSCHGVQKTVA